MHLEQGCHKIIGEEITKPNTKQELAQDALDEAMAYRVITNAVSEKVLDSICLDQTAEYKVPWCINSAAIHTITNDENVLQNKRKVAD